MTDPFAAAGAAVVTATLTAVLFYVWYAATLARVFAQLGGAGWKAWVPIVNESEILRLGGVPAWQVVFFLVPVLNLYGLYLKVAAVARINAAYGRGAGATVLGILLPPVWSTLLSADPASPDPALQERIATSLQPRSGYAFAVSTPSHPSDGTVPPPLVAPPVPPSLVNPDAPRAEPVVPPPVLAPAPLPPAAPVPPAPPAPPVQPAPPVAAPPPAPAAPPPVAAPAPPPAAVAPPAPAAPPVAPPPPPAPPTPVVPPAGLLPPPPVVPSPPSAPPATEEIEAPGIDDDVDRTVVVDRRPVVPWHLVVEGGPTLQLTGSSAVLGRRPAGAGAGAQEVTIPDPTRTLSKVHARLDLADGVWTVTDLHATNGVIVTRADGTEELLDPGASAPVSGRFVLGKVGMTVSFGEEPSAS